MISYCTHRNKDRLEDHLGFSEYCLDCTNQCWCRFVININVELILVTINTMNTSFFKGITL